MIDNHNSINTSETSVVITCYNYGRYLHTCIESVLNQTYRDFEIVVVDDGSTDDTTEIMKSYVKDPSIRYIRQQNSGQTVAKNQGIKKARGKFVAFLDADDKWESNKLELQTALFDNPDVGVVYSLGRFMNEDGCSLGFREPSGFFTPRRGNITNYLFMENFVPFSSTIVRRDCFERMGCFDESLKMGIDWDLWLRLFTKYEFDFVEKPLFYYRAGHPGQMSKNQEERRKCSDQIMKKFLQQFPNALSREAIDTAYYYTYCNRVSSHMSEDSLKALSFFVKAIKSRPFDRRAYETLLRSSCKKLLHHVNHYSRNGKAS